jgi:hypothetical protein
MARARHVREQIAAMRRLFPGFAVSWRDGVVRWRGRIEPTPLSESYLVQIAYRLGAAPSVHVLDPQLLPRSESEPIPHVYGGPELCLYLPRAWEWTPVDLLATTIVPWASLWLRNYEVWHSTGTWHGGGVHPMLRRQRRNRRPRW